ncbi:late competence development ComFB family protein [Desulfovibrio sp. OttesenSCG-928-I05]|nr:late competence development ComFB family protein [Desulfovibrio sp. OttesenSCG-928-I05]
MSKSSERYMIGNVDLFDVRNRNEIRVIAKMRSALEELGNPDIPVRALRDAYALALNLIPARYAQSGTIVLRDPVRDDDLQEAVGKALSQVLTHPKE